jgi:hypothetical protein
MHRIETCSWCERFNVTFPNTINTCRDCGHCSDLPRAQCDCPACLRNPSTPPTPVSTLDSAPRVQLNSNRIGDQQ